MSDKAGEKTRSTHLPTRVEALDAVGSAHSDSKHVASGMRRFPLALLRLNRNRRAVSGLGRQGAKSERKRTLPGDPEGEGAPDRVEEPDGLREGVSLTLAAMGEN